MSEFQKFFQLFWILGFLCNHVLSEDPTVVSSNNGKYKGETQDYFIAFQGIPYAQAPIGENRFEPPKPYTETWADIREATKFAPRCMQWSTFNKKVVGTEDCLFLNVFVPTSVIDSGRHLPVVFYIHGGAFMWGSSDHVHPENMMKKELIFVTIGYRVGILGFMSTQDEVMPGNVGLKDQAFALKWVRENIANFHGDKDKITVAGFSAGGASTHLFYMSPLTENLFRNGISHSGCALNPWVIQENAKEKAHKVADHVNCTKSDNVAMLKCLKEQPAKNLVATVPFFQAYLDNPFSPFGVVVEQPSEHAFLSDFPSKILERGDIYKAPWLAAASIDEGVYPVGEFMSKPEYFPEVAQNWNTLSAHILDLNGIFTDHINKTKIAEAVKLYYFENRTMTTENFHDLTRAVSDRLYHYGIAKAVQKQSLLAPTYYYYFKYKSQFGVGEFISGGRNDLGVAHGEDVFLISPMNVRGPFNADETDLSFKLLEMYLKFSNNNEAQFGGVPMLPIQGKIFNYMEIESPTKYGMKVFEEDFYGNQKFWDEIINYHLEN